MTVKEIVRLVKKYKPKHPVDLEGHVPLQFINSGAYREVYSQKGSRWVIKFPLDVGIDVVHARAEMDAIEKLLTSGKLKKHAPKVYHFDWETGVMVMKRYKKTYATGHWLAKKLVDFFETAPDFEDYCGNFARNGRTLIAVDLGIT